MSDIPPKLPEVQIPEFRKEVKSRWSKCPKCKQQIWSEYTGEQYYHSLPCQQPVTSSWTRPVEEQSEKKDRKKS